VADKELLKLLEKGRDEWNRHRPQFTFGGMWRLLLTKKPFDLSCADLDARDLTGFDLHLIDLTGANLRKANLSSADLSNASLPRANLSDAHLTDANLWNTDLSGADLTGANLFFAFLCSTKLSGADLSNAALRETTLSDLDLNGVKGLKDCRYDGPCSVDFRTLVKSHPLPLQFLRGVGLPDNLIDYLPSLSNQPIQYYSCFISYSSKNDDFAKRIHADLQNKGVRCWFAPHDLPIGSKVLEEIDAAIRLRDRLVLVLSEDSIQSGWVEDEVTTAYDEERRRGQTVLFPIRLDDAIMDTKAAWASKLRMNRNIGDFRRWKNHNHYQKSLERVLRDLTAGPKNSG
jgi:uncharacterized protein YjbI with pentapeptide repeats